MMRFGGQFLTILTVKAVSAAPLFAKHSVGKEANAGGENNRGKPQKY
nr:hypothetical protein [Okeania sp. SIO1I7]